MVFKALSEGFRVLSWTGSLINLPINDLGCCYWHPSLGKLSWKKNGKKRGHCPLLATPPPKRVKRGHLLSDYRQKCVNGTRDILMLKARKMTILAIFGHIVVSKVLIWSIFGHIVVSIVHIWSIFGHIWPYCGVKSPYLVHIWPYCGVKSPFLSDLRIR